jgi:cysteinyl-tRNA synthetase
LDFSDQALQEAKQALEGFYGLFNRLGESENNTVGDKDLSSSVDRTQESFRKAMDDDFNTSVAIAELQRLKGDVNKLLSQGLSTEARRVAREGFRSLGASLGLLQLDKWQFGDQDVPLTGVEARVTGGQLSPKTELTVEQIEQQIAERLHAKRKKNFAQADEIRQFLASHGIVIEDKPDGTSRWKR